MRSSKNVSLMYDDLVTPSFTDLLNNVGNDIKSIKYPPIFLCLLKFISDKGSQRKNTILFIYPYSPFSFFSCSSSITKNRRGNEIPIRVFHIRIESKFRKKKEKRGRRNNSRQANIRAGKVDGTFHQLFEIYQSIHAVFVAAVSSSRFRPQKFLRISTGTLAPLLLPVPPFIRNWNARGID